MNFSDLVPKLRLLCIVILIICPATLWGQELPFVPANEFDEAHEWTSKAKGQYFNFTYDECTGVLSYVFYIYTQGVSDEVQRLAVKLVTEDGNTEQELLEWRIGVGLLELPVYNTLVTPVSSGTLSTKYKSFAGVENVRVRTDNRSNVFVQFDYNVSEGFLFKKNFLNVDVTLYGTIGFNETTNSSIIREDKSSFTTSSLEGPENAPTLTKLVNEPGFKLNFILSSSCNGTYDNDRGPFYEVERANPDESLVTTLQEDIRYRSGSIDFTDNTAVDQCVDYKYRVRTYVRGASGKVYSESSPYSSTIRYTDLLPEPDVVTASDDQCDGTVIVSWTDTDDAPGGYVVFRKFIGETNFTELVTVTSGLNSYTDRSIPASKWNEDVEYRVASKNECGITPEGDLTTITGKALEAVVTPTGVKVVEIIDTDRKGVRITWEDNSAIEDKYLITRQLKGGGGLVNIELAPNTTSYDDFQVNVCQLYVYSVKVVVNSCAADGVADPDEVREISLNADIQGVITEGALIASRGYFTDRVSLNWNVQGLSNNISRYRVFSRPLGAADEPVLIGVVAGTERIFEDEKAEAGQIMEYFLIGETDCGDNILKTNNEASISASTEGVSKAVGFRSPRGVINGNIAYAGGNGVENVKVFAENNNETSGYSLQFDGSGTLTISDAAAQLSTETNALSLAVYVKPELSSILADGSLLAEKDENFSVKLAQDGKLSFAIYLDDAWQELESNSSLQDNKFTSVYATWSGTALKIYLNGVLDASSVLSGTLASGNANPLNIGMDYHGLIDEISLWDVARDEALIVRDRVRLLKQEEPGLIGYWPAIVGLGDQLFDASKSGNKFHGTDGDLTNVIWSSDSPSPDQLGNIGFTDQLGNYTISGIPYSGEGDNFKVTPVFGVHEFSPAGRFIFIGAGNLVQNGVDFEDISSFTVSGTVSFDYKGVKTGSSGVNLLIDGRPLINSNGEFIKTDGNGDFTIDVPIGNHFISVEKDHHTFSNDGRFPIDPDQEFNFNEPVTGLAFTDETRRKLVGKVVGGTREAEKPFGFDKTVNNIGQGRFLLVSSNGDISEDITTDVETGEYSVSLPPLIYNLKQPVSEAEGKILLVTEDRPIDASTGQIDLSALTEVLADYDTVKIVDNIPLPEGVIVDSRIDEELEVRKFVYDLKVNQVYRNTPQVFVYDGSQSGDVDFKGIDNLQLPNKADEPTVIPLKNGDGSLVLKYPAILTNNEYKLKVAVNELYTNSDSGTPVEDKVPVSDALITIDNNMMEAFYLDEERQKVAYEGGITTPQIALNDVDGDTTITFRTLEPEFNTHSNTDLSYTRNFKITVSAGGNIVHWPNAADQNELFRIYVLGGAKGSVGSFTTSGPELVDLIIRDPYGGESFAYLEKGTTLTTTRSYANNNSEELGIDGSVGFEFLGTKVSVSAGVQASVTTDANGASSTELTMLQRFETRSDAQEVGAGGDLYVSSATNYNSGMSRNLSFISSGDCGVAGVTACLTDPPTITHEGKEYTLGMTASTFLEPSGNPTYFVYTQNHIVNTLIPDLMKARNSVLVGNDNYTSELIPSHPHYGSNNDAEHWGLSDNPSDEYDFSIDASGQSYKFVPENDEDIDSVAWFNQQIRLWQDAIKRNELEKAIANNSDDFENFSISGGARLAKEITSSETESYELSYGTSSAFSVGVSTEFDVFGVSANLSANASFTESRSTSYSSETVESVTYGYELFDPDVGDFVSQNVYKGLNGSGPVFILKGGDTSCPHEEAVTTLFLNPVTIIGVSTAQRDKPRIEADVARVFNVPADQKAAFSLNLFNDSESGDDFLYSLQIIDESNPDGAIISMDGEFFDSRRQLFVPGGGAIKKTITIERGPFKYDYNDIKVVMASICQSDPTDFERVIADTVAISASFLPICTTPQILSPSDNWTLNNRFDNKMLIEIGDFDVNFPGFEFIQLEYKASESSDWKTIRKFYRDLEASGNPADGEGIPTTGASFTYEWEIKPEDGILDGAYNLRVLSDCQILSTGGRVESESDTKSGVIDRINPHVFGSPQPGDGILSPGDEISIQFNEPINTAVAPQNFTMRGVLNGADLNHNVSLHFDGTGTGSVTLNNSPNLRRRSFTIDFWAKRSGTGQEIVLHQGASETELLQIGFDGNDQVYFNMNGELFQTAITISNNLWNHYSFAYDQEQNRIEIFVATGSNTLTEAKESFVVDYQVAEAITLGKSTLDDALPFNGFLHELRIWNRIFTESEIAVNRNTILNASTAGLLANWPFDEARGSIGLDKVKSRHAQINTAWRIDPAGKTMSFNGTSSYLESDGVASFTTEQDFTIELWFKTNSLASMSLFSSGKGDLTDDNPEGWTIGLEEGNIFLETNGKKLKKARESLADGQWHHMALVVDRLTNTTLLIDGESRGFIKSDFLGAFSGDKFWYGRRGWKEAGVQMSDQYFEGEIDEFRIWTTARKLREISFNRYNKLTGTELGLRLYYPFESFTLQSGIYLSAENLDNNATGEDAIAATADNQNGFFADDTPPIRLPRPLESVNFNYSVNGDKIILTPNEDNERIENVELSIGVKDIKDLNGNRLSAPITWTAFVDRNDVVWLEDELTLEKSLNEPYSFEVEITNQGGQLRDFTISNLPAWLTAEPANGTLEPTRSKTITFAVDEGLNIGEYNEFVHLTTDFGFDERLSLNLNVFKAPPADWVVNPADFQFSMSLVGAVKISDIFSRDKNDLIAAFVDGEVRGVAPLSYVSQFDQYQVFLSIYTNEDTDSKITYKIWDASEGLVYTGINLSNPGAGKVSPDGFFGTPASPVVLSADRFLENTVVLNEGWNWISFNLNSDDFAEVNTLMSDFPAVENDQIKGTEFFDQYDPVNGWLGSLSSNGGIQKERMYKLNVTNPGDIRFVGSLIDVASAPIDLTEGWNWVGFLGRNNQSVNEALSDISNLSVGDRIKGQREFAIYGGSGIGWVGSLSSMKPGEGYLYYANAAGQLTYPELSIGISNIGSTAGGQSLGTAPLSLDLQKFGLNPADFETNMNLIVELDPVTVLSDDLLLAKSDGQVVGVAYPIDNPSRDANAFFITVYGSASAKIDFELLRGGKNFVLSSEESTDLAYKADTQLGTLVAPLILKAEGFLAESVSAKATPNPFENTVRISWIAEGPPRSIEVMNPEGVLMQNVSQPRGSHQELSFVGMAQGLYMIRLHFEGEVKVLKVIKSK